MPEQLSLSVVIATLGGSVLQNTIAHLNSGDRIPAEILVCIPEAVAVNKTLPNFENVKLIPTPCRGQVSQRAYGLKMATQNMVLQIDDDILIKPIFLEILLSALIKLGPGNVVAPFFQQLDGTYITKYSNGWRGLLQSIQASFICGAPWGLKRMGKLSPAGIGYWFDRTHVGNNPIETEWIPGGCALCYKEDLVLESYFPYIGKAFSEDLIHSVLWRRKGAHLWAVPSSQCMTTVAPVPFDLKQLISDFHAHDYVIGMINGAPWRLRLWFALYVSKLWLRHAKSHITRDRNIE